MAETVQRYHLIEHLDAYLEYHNHSELALQHALNVLTKFDYMVTLAVDRAKEALAFPGMPEPNALPAVVIPFPNREPSYDDPQAS